jgi:methionyl-tRNA synthetase
MPQKTPYYITTAISYPNGLPHIGHAYEVIAADAIARFKRLDGYDVFFQTGTDEHGLKIQQTALKNGVTPRAFVDEMAPHFRNMAEKLNCSFDRFIRTTDADHLIATQELWRLMQERGDIYLSNYTGWYSVRDEAYYDEAELTLLESGERRAPTGTPVEWVEEESYFFRLSAYQNQLLEHYQNHPEFIGPASRLNEIVSFVSGGLQDLCISRTTFDWGLSVPNEPAHVMYVWIDALNNYLTGAGFPDQNSAQWRYWPADVHIIGKDITRFHAVYWPAFLMSAGLSLPKRIFGHGFLFNRGEKMSKSLGNVIDPITLADRYGVDQLRYFFLREVPFGQDGHYSHEAITGRINADLANDLGNLVQRSLSMIAKNCLGKIPSPQKFTAEDEALLNSCKILLPKIRMAMEQFALHTILADIWSLVGDANRYFAAQEPWRLTKTDPARRDTVLYVTIEVIRHIALLTQPFIPDASARFLDLLQVENRDFAHVEVSLEPGTALPEPKPVFPRFVEEEPSA